MLRGLLPKSAKKKPDVPAGTDGGEPSPLPQALLKDLALYRQQIVQAELAKQPELAADVWQYVFCSQLLSDYWWGHLVAVRASVSEENTSLRDLESTTASVVLQAQYAKLDTAWLSMEDDVACFAAFRRLSAEMKAQLVAYATALVFELGQHRSDELTCAASVAHELEIDYARYWRPTAENYFKRLKTPQLLALGEAWFGATWVEDHRKDKKGALVTLFHELFHGDDTGLSAREREIREQWMPEGFS